MPKFFVGEQPFCVVFQRTYGSEILKKTGKGIKSFSLKFFVSLRKILVAEQPLCAVFQKISGSGKCLEAKRGSVKRFPGKLVVSQC